MPLRCNDEAAYYFFVLMPFTLFALQWEILGVFDHMHVDPRRVRHIFIIDLSIGLTITGLFLCGVFLLINSRTVQLFGDIVPHVETTERIVALTFDDGPEPEKTWKLLDMLKLHNVKATFYPIGKESERYPVETKAIISEGHEIGNHSYSHSWLAFANYRFVKKDIERADEVFRRAGYEGRTTFRPPYGDKFYTLPRYAKDSDRITVMWDVNPDDQPSVAGDSQKIAEYVIRKVSPGSIILLHPTYEHHNASLYAIEPIIEGLHRDGYRFVTVSELLSYRDK